MKLKSSLPNLLAAFIGIVAISLILHTGASRSASAKALRLASEKSARDSARHTGDDASSTEGTHGFTRGASLHGRDLEKRMGDVLTIANIFDQTRALLGLMKDFTPEDFKVALDACPQMADDFRSTEFMRIFGAWADRDPQAALAYASGDAKLKEAALERWVIDDREAAVKWAREDASHDPEGKSLGTVIQAVARRDPWAAIEYLGELNPEFVHATIYTICRTGDPAMAEAILKWADAVGDPVVASAAARSVFWSWNERQPQQPRFEILRSHPEALSEGQDLGQAFALYSRQDMNGARDAIGLIPPGTLQQKAVAGLVRELLKGEDAAVTAEVMAEYPDIADDKFMADAVAQLTYENPLRALERTSLIQDPTVREDAYARVLASWTEKNPEAAGVWLGENNIPEALRGKMEKYIATNKKIWSVVYDSEQTKASGR